MKNLRIEMRSEDSRIVCEKKGRLSDRFLLKKEKQSFWDKMVQKMYFMLEVKEATDPMGIIVRHEGTALHTLFTTSLYDKNIK